MTKSEFIIDCTIKVLQGFAMVKDNYVDMKFGPQDAVHTAICIAETASQELERDFKVFSKE